MTEKQPVTNGNAVTQDPCSEDSCSTCYIYRGCMHQQYSFWQALCDAAAYPLQQTEQLKARLYPNRPTTILAK